MRGWWQDLAGLVFPAGCAGCGSPRAVLCDRCRAALGGHGPRRVRPSPVPPGLPAVHAAAPYADEARAVLLAHKERGALGLAGPLGGALAGAVRTACSGSGPVLLVPVPSSRRAVAARGHDPVRRIALAAAGELRSAGLPVRVLPVLRQRRAVTDQSALPARRRRENLCGALEAVTGRARPLDGAPVVLVDDLMTTGASLAEGARALAAAGGRLTGAAVVAAPLDAFRSAAVATGGGGPVRAPG